MFAVTVNSALTLCMLGLVYRWSAPYLEVDIHRGPLGWLPRYADPYVGFIRRMLPPSGAMDMAPLVAVAILWVARIILTGY